MSRPNRGRTLGSERTLARRVAYERSTRGMTYAQLAREMTSVGCAIRGSALYKIENNEPPRRVTVNELVALSLVFEIALDELLVPYRRIDSRVGGWSRSGLTTETHWMRSSYGTTRRGRTG